MRHQNTHIQVVIFLFFIFIFFTPHDPLSRHHATYVTDTVREDVRARERDEFRETISHLNKLNMRERSSENVNK